MDPNDQFVAALGVLLTQVRTARRALEDVQRSTSRYMGFEFAKALAEGPRFGQPPMYQGALMVHIVNINDLAPGNSFGAFIESLFGGIGNFFSNLIGGAAGSFLTALQLPKMLERIERIVQNVSALADRLGGGKKPDKAAVTDASKSKPQAQAETGESFLTTLDGIRGTIRDVTALFEAAGSGPGDSSGPNKAGKTSQTPLTNEGERWMAILSGVNRLLDRTAHIIDALIIAIPIVIGSIALLVTNLGAIRNALLETVQFILRNALILRGVLLTVIFETVASAARLAASIVTTLGTAIQGILASIIGVVKAIVSAAFDALKTLANALQAIVRSLLEWMVTGVFNTLRAIGELSVFRTIDHLIKILPALIPAIFSLMNQGKVLDPGIQKQLTQAHEAAFPPGGGAPAGGTGAGTTTVTIGEFPDIAKILQPMEATLSTAVDKTAEGLKTAATATFGEAEGALTGLAGKFTAATEAEADFSKGILDKHAKRIIGNADTLAKTITAPLEATGADTGLEEIAKAYQDWLTGGGLKGLLDQIAPHFTNKPGQGEPGGPLRLLRGQFDRPRASIDIERVEIVIEPAVEPSDTEIRDLPDVPRRNFMTDEEVYAAVVRHTVELEDRGIRLVDAAAVVV